MTPYAASLARLAENHREYVLAKQRTARIERLVRDMKKEQEQ